MDAKPYKRIQQGIVTSAKMTKTITVLVERYLAHPTYGKYYKASNKFLAHDDQQTAKEGDIVRIIECRPLSRHKRWRLLEIVQRKV